MSKLKIITFDTETSGVDTDNDRIITCFMRAKGGDKIVFEQNWIIDPGIEIPEGASEVHGMTTEWVRENGRKDVKEAIDEISKKLWEFATSGHIVVGYNASFDLSILESEVKRHIPGADELSIKYDSQVRFLDPIVIDRAVDKFRKGSRKLVDVAKHYGVEVDEDKLHDASEDVRITEQLLPLVLNKAWSKLADERQGKTPDEFITFLQEKQKEWKSHWAEGLTEYFARQGKLEEDGSPIVVNGRFPY